MTTYCRDNESYLDCTNYVLQVQKLLSKHKAELAAVQQACTTESSRQLDTQKAQHELVLRQLKEKMAQVCVDAVCILAGTRPAHNRPDSRLIHCMGVHG